MRLPAVAIALLAVRFKSFAFCFFTVQSVAVLGLAVGQERVCASEADGDNDWNSNAKKDADKKKEQDEKDKGKQRGKDEKEKQKAKEKEQDQQQEREKQKRDDAEDLAKQQEKERKKREKDKKNKDKEEERDKDQSSSANNAAPSDKNAMVVFYTPGEKHWDNAEQIIDAVNKKYPKLKVTKVPVNSPAARMSLAQVEDVYKIKEHGDITATFEGFVLVSRGEQRMVEESFEAVCERILGEAHLKGKISADVTGYIKEIFGPQATTVLGAPATDANDYYPVLADNKIVGWVANGFHHITCPICIDTQFLVAVKSPELKVIDMRPVRPLERSGARLDKPEVDKFMKQFSGRTPQDGVKPVDGISGATTTSTGYLTTVNEILQEIAKREKPPASPVAKPEVKPDAKPDTNSDVKPETKSDAKPASK